MTALSSNKYPVIRLPDSCAGRHAGIRRWLAIAQIAIAGIGILASLILAWLTYTGVSKTLGGLALVSNTVANQSQDVATLLQENRALLSSSEETVDAADQQLTALQPLLDSIGTWMTNGTYVLNESASVLDSVVTVIRNITDAKLSLFGKTFPVFPWIGGEMDKLADMVREMSTKAGKLKASADDVHNRLPGLVDHIHDSLELIKGELQKTKEQSIPSITNSLRSTSEGFRDISTGLESTKWLAVAAASLIAVLSILFLFSGVQMWLMSQTPP